MDGPLVSISSTKTDIDKFNALFRAKVLIVKAKISDQAQASLLWNKVRAFEIHSFGKFIWRPLNPFRRPTRGHSQSKYGDKGQTRATCRSKTCKSSVVIESLSGVNST